MKLFGGSDSARPERPGTEGQQPQAVASYRMTLDLKRAETIAVMLAHSRTSQFIEVADYLAGMYLSNWDHLSQYWNEHDRDDVEEVLRGICQISPQRWHAWIELYDREREKSERKPWEKLLPFKKEERSAEKPIKPSAALETVLKKAGEIAPAYDRSGQRSIPILTTECVLLCILRNLGSEISRKLARTGFDVAKLEREALLPRHPPRV